MPAYRRGVPENNPRRQRAGRCKVCQGAARFYPKPLDQAAVAADADAVSEWVHLNPADWLANPHPVDPDETAAAG